MDFSFSAEENAFRKEVRAFLDAELPEEGLQPRVQRDAELWKFAFEFTRKVGEKGWIGLTWPPSTADSAGAPAERLILAEEFAAAEAPLVNVIGWGLAAGALLVGGPTSRSGDSCRASPFRRFWAEGLTSPTRARTWRRCRPGPSVTVTTGSSPARRRTPPGATTPT